MQKLSTLFAVVALATTIGLSGCKKKQDGAASAGKAAEGEVKTDTTATPAAAPDNATATTTTTATTGSAATAGSAAPAATAGALPSECNDYKAAIDKLSSCDKMPQQSRDALKQAYDQASAGWANLPADAKANLATACKAGADAVTTSAKQVCGW